MTLQGTMLAPIEAAAQEKGAAPAIHDRNGDGTWSTTNWALFARRDDDERRLADAQSSLQDLGSHVLSRTLFSGWSRPTCAVKFTLRPGAPASTGYR